jgi:uncharacterized membrane protein YjgN (DUF898 family)
MAALATVTALPVTADTWIGFRFDGGPASWFGVQLAGLIVTLGTLGICYPWAVVMVYRWKASHTYVNGRGLMFTGSARSLFRQWIKWWALSIITLGLYTFWVYPRMARWTIEHQIYAD